MSKHRSDMTPLTREDIKRFEANAPAALRRRGGDFMFREICRGFEQILIGGWPLIGAWLLDWSATEMVIFYLARMWAAILCDVAKLCLLKPAVMRFAKVAYDDWHVWTVTQALREKKTQVMKSHLRASYEPWVGVLIDFTFGVVGTVVIWLCLVMEVERPITEHFELASFRWSLTLALVYQFAMAILEISRHLIDPDDDSQVKIACGTRGIGLFLLMFVAVVGQETIKDGDQLAGWIMMIVNGTIVFFGFLNIAAYKLVDNETKWLTKYMKDKNHPSSSATMQANDL